jgi:hypothetical protein
VRARHATGDRDAAGRADDRRRERDEDACREPERRGGGRDQRGKPADRDHAFEQDDGKHHAADPEQRGEPQRHDCGKRRVQADRRPDASGASELSKAIVATCGPSCPQLGRAPAQPAFTPRPEAGPWRRCLPALGKCPDND